MPSESGIFKRFGADARTPLVMRTWRQHAWDCPWCRKHVQGGEVHDDRMADKFGFVPKTERSA